MGHKRKWLDGRLYAGPVARISMQPTDRIQCNGERECSQIDQVNTSSVMEHAEGKCSALLTREGFFDFLVFKTQCNVSHSVAVVCQHNNGVNLVFNNSMSDIKLSLVDGFQSIQMFSSCDPGWFMVDDVCTNFYHCPDCMNSDAHAQCSVYGGQLAYHLLNNVTISTPGNKLDKTTKLSLFWDMFYHMEDINGSFGSIRWELDTVKKYRKYFAVNGSAICLALNNGNECTEDDIVLLVGYHTGLYMGRYRYENEEETTYLWSVIYQPIFERRECADMSLCEKSVAHAAVLTNCSEYYMTCHEGTCVHDSLVCDGHSHCPHGEDEADCEHICSDHSDNCMSHCRYRDLCFCSLGYFQCLSGGCVPLQKLCDQTDHCIDASDEPATCVYLRPEQLSNHSLSLDINNYINTLIQQNMIAQDRCLQSNNNKSLLYVQNVEYKMHSKLQTCSPSSLPSDVKIICGIFDIFHDYPDHRSQYYFSLDRLCVYDHDCDDDYNYHCFNDFHLLKCEHMYCVRRFKCPSSYCISFDHICNKVCDCPSCEDESLCSKLLCPGMVLIEQKGSGLRCSMNVATLKHSIHFRQVIHSHTINITDDFPVFIYLDNVNLKHYILTPEVVAYCEILYSNFVITDFNMFHHMVSLRRLLLPHNNIEIVHDSMLASMSELSVLDLSHNLIKYISQITLCSLHNLQYISLHHNLIVELPAHLFINNRDVQVLLLNSNKLTPETAIIDVSLPSLYHLSSDIPRLCCAFNTVKICSPPFPLFVSCSNLITSKALIVLGWLIGLSTPILSISCISLLIYKIFSPATRVPRVIMLYSTNLSLAEFVTSLCLLSYSVINVVYDDEFGIIADQWRQSFKCLSLESLFSVSSRTCLAFAVCLSVHFAIHIPSVIPKKSSLNATFFQIIIIWIVITSICITVQVLEHVRNIDPFNYFCFPFTTYFPSDPLILSLQSVLLILDIILIMVTVVSYVYLLVFSIRRSKNKTLQCVNKRKEKLQKLAVRLTILILSTVLTWMPVVCVQILVLVKITILPDIYLWCILVSFPINLIIDPILLIRNMLS